MERLDKDRGHFTGDAALLLPFVTEAEVPEARFARDEPEGAFETSLVTAERGGGSEEAQTSAIPVETRGPAPAVDRPGAETPVTPRAADGTDPSPAISRNLPTRCASEPLIDPEAPSSEPAGTGPPQEDESTTFDSTVLIETPGRLGETRSTAPSSPAGSKNASDTSDEVAPAIGSAEAVPDGAPDDSDLRRTFEPSTSQPVEREGTIERTAAGARNPGGVDQDRGSRLLGDAGAPRSLDTKASRPLHGTPEPKTSGVLLETRFDRVLEQLEGVIRPGRDTMVLDLRPPELGRIVVDLKLEDGRVVADLVATSDETAAALHRDVERLRQAFVRAGVPVAGVHVSTSGNESGTSGRRRPDDDDQRLDRTASVFGHGVSAGVIPSPRSRSGLIDLLV